jgi:hypothetical protein
MAAKGKWSRSVAGGRRLGIFRRAPSSVRFGCGENLESRTIHNSSSRTHPDVGDVVSWSPQIAAEATATAGKSISQKTIVELMCALRELSGNTQGSEVPVHYTELLYAHDFRLWFVAHAENYYHWNWQRILFELRDGRFFFSQESPTSDSHTITGGCLSAAEAMRWGELFTVTIAIIAMSILFSGVFEERPPRSTIEGLEAFGIQHSPTGGRTHMMSLLTTQHSRRNPRARLLDSKRWLDSSFDAQGR